MSKKPMSWLELIKLKLKEEKDKGKSPSINDIMPAAKKEWAQIKAGTHPDYMQGKGQTFARKKKGASDKKTRKASASASHKSASASASASSSASPSTDDIQAILDEVKMCGKCKKKVEKILAKKNMKGGYNQFYNVATIGKGDGTLLPSAGGPTDFQGYDKNVPTYSALTGGGKKGKKKGGCGSCVSGGAL
jgi:hypothetical protein